MELVQVNPCQERLKLVENRLKRQDIATCMDAALEKSSQEFYDMVFFIEHVDFTSYASETIKYISNRWDFPLGANQLYTSLYLLQQVLRNSGVDPDLLDFFHALFEKSFVLQLPSMIPEQAFPILTLLGEIQVTVAMKDVPFALTYLQQLVEDHTLISLNLLQKMIHLDTHVFDQISWFSTIVQLCVLGNPDQQDVSMNFMTSLLQLSSIEMEVKKKLTDLANSSDQTWGATLHHQFQRKGVPFQVSEPRPDDDWLSRSSS
jgi:hypothetical protein